MRALTVMLAKEMIAKETMPASLRSIRHDELHCAFQLNLNLVKPLYFSSFCTYIYMKSNSLDGCRSSGTILVSKKSAEQVAKGSARKDELKPVEWSSGAMAEFPRIVFAISSSNFWRQMMAGSDIQRKPKQFFNPWDLP